MKSHIADALKLAYHPVATFFQDTEIDGALKFKQGRWGCAVALYNTVAKKGRWALFSRKTTMCFGGIAGLCFGNNYHLMQGGIENFLSTGSKQRQGERYKKNPELAKAFVDKLPYVEIPKEYLVLKPLKDTDPDKPAPGLISFFVNPDQLSALTVLANFDREGGDNVIIPFSSGCQSLCLLPHNESKKPLPKAVVGLTDITVRNMLDPNILSFTVPYPMFMQMEQNVDDSFLKLDLWAKVAKRIE